MPKRNGTAERHPVSDLRVQDLDSTALQAQLVTDALRGFVTPLAWFVAACDRIARLDRISSDDAYQRVRTEVAALGGVMPAAPGS